MQSPKVFELSLIITLVVVTVVFTVWKEVTAPVRTRSIEPLALQIEDIPITSQIKPPPPPPRPQVPVEIDEPALAGDFSMPNLGEWSDQVPPPPPPPIDDKVIEFVSVEHPPVMIGGENALNQYIIAHNLFPAMAIKTGVSGICVIEFTVDTYGNPVNLIIDMEKPGGLGFGEAGLKAVAAMKFKPGIQSDRLVNVRMRQEIRFNVK